MNLLPFAIGWCVLAAVAIGLLIYRRTISGTEDDALHVGDPTGAIIARQEMLAKRLESVDRWGKLLTVVLVLYGLGLAAAYFYNVWTSTATYSG